MAVAECLGDFALIELAAQLLPERRPFELNQRNATLFSERLPLVGDE
jgi:hypothetical protein